MSMINKYDEEMILRNRVDDRNTRFKIKEMS